MTDTPNLKSVREIAPGLWQGSMYLAHEFGEWDALHERIKPDVVLVMAQPPFNFVGHDDVLYYSLIIDDDPNGIPENVFRPIYDIISGLSEKRIITFCFMGENRSGLASAMALHARGTPIEDAIAAVTCDKLGWENSQNGLWNPGFQRQLRESLA